MSSTQLDQKLAEQEEELTVLATESEEVEAEVPSVDYEAPVIEVPSAHTCEANCY